MLTLFRTLLITLVAHVYLAQAAAPTQYDLDLTATVADLNSTTKNVTQWNGQVYDGIYLYLNITKDSSDIKKLQTDCQNQATSTSAQCNALVANVNGQFEPALNRSLQAFISRKPDFVKRGLLSLIDNGFKNLTNQTDAWGGCFVSKCPANQQSFAKAALAKIDYDLAIAVKAFSSSS